MSDASAIATEEMSGFDKHPINTDELSPYGFPYLDTAGMVGIPCVDQSDEKAGVQQEAVSHDDLASSFRGARARVRHQRSARS